MTATEGEYSDSEDDSDGESGDGDGSCHAVEVIDGEGKGEEEPDPEMVAVNPLEISTRDPLAQLVAANPDLNLEFVIREKVDPNNNNNVQPRQVLKRLKSVTCILHAKYFS